MKKVVWDADGNEWRVDGDRALLIGSLHEISTKYDPSIFYESYADFVRGRIAYEKDNAK